MGEIVRTCANVFTAWADALDSSSSEVALINSAVADGQCPVQSTSALTVGARVWRRGGGLHLDSARNTHPAVHTGTQPSPGLAPRMNGCGRTSDISPGKGMHEGIPAGPGAMQLSDAQ